MNDVSWQTISDIPLHEADSESTDMAASFDLKASLKALEDKELMQFVASILPIPAQAPEHSRYSHFMGQLVEADYELYEFVKLTIATAVSAKQMASAANSSAAADAKAADMSTGEVLIQQKRETDEPWRARQRHVDEDLDDIDISPAGTKAATEDLKRDYTALAKAGQLPVECIMGQNIALFVTTMAETCNRHQRFLEAMRRKLIGGVEAIGERIKFHNTFILSLYDNDFKKRYGNRVGVITFPLLYPTPETKLLNIQAIEAYTDVEGGSARPTKQRKQTFFAAVTGGSPFLLVQQAHDGNHYVDCQPIKEQFDLQAENMKKLQAEVNKAKKASPAKPAAKPSPKKGKKAHGKARGGAVEGGDAETDSEPEVTTRINDAAWALMSSGERAVFLKARDFQ